MAPRKILTLSVLPVEERQANYGLVSLAVTLVVLHVVAHTQCRSKSLEFSRCCKGVLLQFPKTLLHLSCHPPCHSDCFNCHGCRGPLPGVSQHTVACRATLCN